MTSVIAHRGASHDFPANTIEAFGAAADQGADGVELDVRATSDGVLVVHHDPLLPDGRVIADLAANDLPSSVPTLAAALTSMRTPSVNVEIKNSPVEPGYDPSGWLAAATVDVIGETASALDVIVSSFELDTLVAVRAAARDLDIGYLVLSPDEPVDAVAAAVDGGYVAIHPWDPCVTEASIRRAHDAGVRVNVWTVDDPDRIRQLAVWGVDAVITNRPAVAREALRRG